jgi:alpha-L-fucosidase
VLFRSQTDYNAVRRGPGRDLVAEHVAACREFGLRVGLYYSLMDWHHPDGARCATDEAARRRFVAFTHGCVRELLSNYGQIDILWYDVPWPLDGAQWEARRLSRMARSLQPHLIINDRAWLPEDFTTPEEMIKPPAPGRAWESCMTFNGSWGYMPAAVDWHSARKVVDMLRQVAAGGGNLVLNIGPRADGAVPPEAVSRLRDVGKWLARNGEAIYGRVTPVRDLEWLATGNWTQKGNVAYLWVHRWQPGELAVGGLKTRLRRASYLATGQAIRFRQEPDRLVLTGLPKACPDPVVGCCVVKLEFVAPPRQALGAGCVTL